MRTRRFVVAYYAALVLGAAWLIGDNLVDSWSGNACGPSDSPSLRPGQALPVVLVVSEATSSSGVGSFRQVERVPLNGIHYVADPSRATTAVLGRLPLGRQTGAATLVDEPEGAFGHVVVNLGPETVRLSPQVCR